MKRQHDGSLHGELERYGPEQDQPRSAHSGALGHHSGSEAVRAINVSIPNEGGSGDWKVTYLLDSDSRLPCFLLIKN
jgi:hypothetical protein